MPETVGTIATGMEGTGQSPDCLGYNALLNLHLGNWRTKTHIASGFFLNSKSSLNAEKLKNSLFWFCFVPCTNGLM